MQELKLQDFERKYRRKSSWAWVRIFRYDTKNIIYKRKNDELDFIKIKSFCVSKEIIKKIKG